MIRNPCALAPALALALLSAAPVRAADPVRIGITTILSGPLAERGQQEQYGAQLALNEINMAGGVLGRPVEVFYADNACKPEVGVPAVRRLLDQQHVPVVIGALCTPVTHAIEPVMAAAKVPLIIATSAGQDFVDASGAGGNDYLFKTIPSELDIARGLVRYLQTQGVRKVAVASDADPLLAGNGAAMAKAATEAGMTVTQQTVVPAGTKDLAPLVADMKAGSPDALMMMFGPSAADFLKAYAASGWTVPLSGRLDVAAAYAALSPASREAARITSVTLFTPLADAPGVKRFVQSYLAHYGLAPTQRSFFVYEAVLWAADAVRKAGTDTPAAIEAALKTSDMPSMLGGTYKLDDHNHPHTPLFILGIRDGKPAVVATE